MNLNALTQLNRNFLQFDTQFKFQPKVQERETLSALTKDPFALTEKILNQNLNKLGIATEATEFDRPKSVFNAEEIAKNVLSFVRAKLKRAEAEGADTNELRDILSQAKSGVEKGIAEANDVLNELGFLTDDIKTGIQQASDLIFKGLDPDQPESAVAAGLVEISQAFRQVEKQGFELSVRTQEGDTVNIRFNRVDEQSSRASFQQSDAGSVFSSQQTTLSSSQLSFSIEGDLDEDELNSIKSLVKDINQTAETFYDGDIQTAFEQGLNLGFNTEEIAEFSLQLNRSVSTVATTQYRAVSELGATQLTPPGSESLGAVLDQLRGAINAASQFLENAEAAVTNLFQPLLERQPQSGAFNDLLEKHQEKFNTLARSLIQPTAAESAEPLDKEKA